MRQASPRPLHDGRTALGLMEALNPQPGEWVLVVGAAGGLGALLVQLAQHAGCRVLAAARGKQKLDQARELGATTSTPPGTPLGPASRASACQCPDKAKRPLHGPGPAAASGQAAPT
jgi:Zn-dependent alcohol dehydrogenase